MLTGLFVSGCTKQAETQEPQVITKSLVTGTITTKKNNVTTEVEKDVKKAVVNDIKMVDENIIFLMSPIDEYSVNETIRQLEQMQNKKGEIYMLIDSPGGSVYDGVRLITQIEDSKVPVNTVCVGMCASVAAMIHSYGKRRLMTNRSVLMYHPASGGIQGQIQNIASRIKSIQTTITKLEDNVQKRSGLSKKEYDSRIAYEFWVDSDEAKELNLVDDVVSLSKVVPPVSSGPISIFSNERTHVRELDLYWIFPGHNKSKATMSKNE